MTQPRPPRPYDALERRIHDLEAAKLRHANLARIARLERDIAALPDPREATASEVAMRASDARLRGILEDMAGIGESLD